MNTIVFLGFVLFVGLVQADPAPEKNINVNDKDARWSFGAILNSSYDGVEIGEFGQTDVKEDERLLVKTIKVDVSTNDVTTFVTATNNTVTAAEGCVKTYFVTVETVDDIKKHLEKMEDNSIVLFTGKNLVNLTADLFYGSQLTLGFFKGVKLSTTFLEDLIKNDISYFNNLEKPEGFKEASMTLGKTYYFGFRFVFVPFANQTSVNGINRKVNLAELTVFNNGNMDVMNACENVKTSSVNILNEPFGPVDKIPSFGPLPKVEFDGVNLIFNDHYGTHLDSPHHFSAKGFDSTNMPKSLNVVDYVKVTIPKVGNESITRDDLIKFETETEAKIPEGSMVILETKNWKNWNNKTDYETNVPGLTLDAAKFLIEKRRAIALAMDSLAFDPAPLAFKMNFPVHTYMGQEEIVCIVNVGTNSLEYAPGRGGKMVMSYLKIEEGTGGQVAMFVLPDLATSVDAKDNRSKNNKENESSSVSATVSLLVLAVLAAFY